MSDINILDNETSHELSLTSQSVDHIRVMAKWGTFLSIVGFVFIGLMVIVALFAGAMFSSIASDVPGFEVSGMGGIITGVYLFFAALYIYPTWQLNHFSRKAKSAIARNNTPELTEALKSLRGFFAFFGILTAVVLGLYAVMFVVSGIAALLS